MTVKLLNSYSNEKDLFGYYDKNNTMGLFFVMIFQTTSKIYPIVKNFKYTKHTTVDNIEPSNDNRVNKEKEQTT